MITVSNILPFAKNRTAPTKIEKQLYAKIDTWQKQYILTCGTTLGLFYNNLNISVTKKLDKALGYENFGWANEPFITSMQYCTVTLRHWELRYSEFKKGLKRTGMRTVGSEENWPLFLTPIIIVYRRKAVFRLVHEGLTEYWEHAKDCKTHEFFKEDMDKYLGEIPLPPHLKPFPAMIIVGKCGIEHDLSAALEKLQVKYSYVPIFHLPNLPFKALIENGAVNTHRTSMPAIKLLCELKEKFSDYIETL